MLKSIRQPRVLEAAGRPRADNFLLRFILSQRFLALIGLVFLVAVIFPLLKTHNQRLLVEREIADLQAQIYQFENQSQQLSELLAYLQSEQSLEDQARLSLNMKKPGEGVIIIDNKKEAGREQAGGVSFEQKSNFEKWWQYFFN